MPGRKWKASDLLAAAGFRSSSAGLLSADTAILRSERHARSWGQRLINSIVPPIRRAWRLSMSEREASFLTSTSAAFLFCRARAAPRTLPQGAPARDRVVELREHGDRAESWARGLVPHAHEAGVLPARAIDRYEIRGRIERSVERLFAKALPPRLQPSVPGTSCRRERRLTRGAVPPPRGRPRRTRSLKVSPRRGGSVTAGSVGMAYKFSRRWKTKPSFSYIVGSNPAWAQRQDRRRRLLPSEAGDLGTTQRRGGHHRRCPPPSAPRLPTWDRRSVAVYYSASRPSPSVAFSFGPTSRARADVTARPCSRNEPVTSIGRTPGLETLRRPNSRTPSVAQVRNDNNDLASIATPRRRRGRSAASMTLRRGPR